MKNNTTYDAIVIGAGHAGVEAGLSLARLNKSVLLVTLSLDSISNMACNPNIGGTAKGHLVREIDALGGQMGITADEAVLQLRMLNLSKGAAVHSLRGQEDKIMYHLNMKKIVENEPNITILQGEVVNILTADDGSVCGVTTDMGNTYNTCTIVLCCGVYLNSDIIIGEWRKAEGPSGFSRATSLTESLISHGMTIRRFKTGTPARVDKKTIDFSKMTEQMGDKDIYPFSFINDKSKPCDVSCYLTYTNENTHQIIRDNIHRSPLYNGTIKSIGPRYCPSIEDKVMRFADKDRHQIFIEPESMFTDEMYVQGMSSSLPIDVQLEMYRSIAGMENVNIMRYAYAIEYDCIDSTELDSSLMVKNIKGLFTAGQINGSSGYEEAAAQGLIAGINASLYIDKKPPFILTRDKAYIGVLIDDLVTKGTNEPYRMMTARAEFRLNLRQENADIRLTVDGYELGLVSKDRYDRYLRKTELIELYINDILNKHVQITDLTDFFNSIGESIPSRSLSYKDMLKRATISADMIMSTFKELSELDVRVLREVETMIKYEGYLTKQDASIRELKKLEDRQIPSDTDYSIIEGLRLEAKQKLAKIAPLNLGQASRISGVSPADITVLMISLFKK